MQFGALAPLFAPVVLWGILGLSFVLAFPRSGSSTLFRLAALFLGVWSLLATTGLVWVLENGGWSGAVRLAGSPWLLFEPGAWLLWVAGALGAFSIFFAAFWLNQTVARGFLLLYPSNELPWPSRLPTPTRATSLRAFRSETGGAFAFTLLERGGRRGVHRRDVIMVSDRLLSALEAREWEAVLAHEVGHLDELDGRYLTFFRILSRMMRWDPILAYFAESLTRREEYRADLDAVELTQRPRALARALYKATFLSAPVGGNLPGLLGVGGRRGRRQTVERIRRLVALAESGRFPEETSA